MVRSFLDTPTTPQPEGKMYKLQAGAFGVRDNAAAEAKRIKDQYGIETFVIEV